MEQKNAFINDWRGCPVRMNSNTSMNCCIRAQRKFRMSKDACLRRRYLPRWIS